MCCGSKDDYYTVTPYRPSYEKPHPSVSRGYSERHHQPQPRDPRREARDKQQRQIQASAAAQRYGWPTARAVPGPLTLPSERDSVIEQGLAEGLAAVPGWDFRPVYDPHRPRHHPNYSPNPPRPTQSLPHGGNRIVNRQPGRTPPMQAPSMGGQPNRNARKETSAAPKQFYIEAMPEMGPPTRATPKRTVRGESPAIPSYLARPMPPTNARPIQRQPRNDMKTPFPRLPVVPIPSMQAPAPARREKDIRAARVPHEYPTRPMPSAYAPPIKTSFKQQHSSTESPIAHQRPGIAREVVVHKQDRPPPEPEAARWSYLSTPTRPVRRRSRDSNNVSLFSDDGDEFSRDYVSP